MVTKRTLLIVEDQEVNRKILKQFLKEEYNFLEAADGVEAMEILKKEKNISAILLDLIMPNMDGYAVLEELGKSASLASIPVIVATQDDKDGTEVKALSMGAWDFVAKPYKPQVIKQRLKNLINLKEAKVTVDFVEHDTLTGLLNREGFYHHVLNEIQTNPERGYNIVVTDLEHFKLVNDTYGNQEGDKLLRFMAEISKSLIDLYGGICARINADQFLMLFSDETDLNQVITIYQNKLRTYPISMKLYVKFGIYEIEDNSLNISAMCDRASLALASIKGRYDKIYCYYDDTLREQLLLEQQIIDDMGPAIRNREFKVYIQPKYNLQTGKIVGAESLIRWQHPKFGFLTPNRFIPIFEKHGFITEIDMYVWEQTCAIIAEWKQNHLQPVPVSVNVSRKDIYNIDLPELLKKLISKYDLQPADLHLEITETAYTEDSVQLVEVVQKLKEYGFEIEMDDFGSGYSSLNMIADLPIDILKLDMRFIQAKQKTEYIRSVVQLVIDLAKGMNLRVIAEGVETEEQVMMLRELCCDYAQGYYYSKPVPYEEITPLLSKIN